MENEFQEVLSKVNELEGKDLAVYIDKLFKENNKALNNRKVLLAMAEKVVGYNHTHYIVKDKLSDLGLNLHQELEKINEERTRMFMEENSELMGTINVVTGWWIEAIKKPFFKNFHTSSVPIREEMFIKFPHNKAKIEEKNRIEFTEEKQKVFTEALAFEIADKIRKEGKCHLWINEQSCWEINKCIDKANLRLKVYLPPKVDMMITTNQIMMRDGKDSWKVVYTNNENDKNDSFPKKM